MFRRMCNRLLAIMLVASALELMRRVRLAVNVVRSLESVIKSRGSGGSTQPLQD